MTVTHRHRVAVMVAAAVPVLLLSTAPASADDEMQPYPGCPECGGPPLRWVPAPVGPPEGRSVRLSRLIPRPIRGDDWTLP